MSEYKWIAQDEDGWIFRYKDRPSAENNTWYDISFTRIEKGLKNESWLDSLINLETHDYKIEDGILMKVEKQKILKGSELQYKDKSGQWNNCSYDEYRIKPKTVKFRNYLDDTGNIKVTTTESTEKERFFVRWLKDWQEASVDYQPDQQWPTELVARIAKIDLQAAEWLMDNWDELETEKYMRPEGNNKNSDNLKEMFSWTKTPQKGWYWFDISFKLGEKP